MKTVPVLICGAGPVGLTLSLLLSRLGIENLIVEKHASTSIHPKARGVNVRTMELFRKWGIEKQIRAHELPASMRRFLWLTQIQGEIIGEVSLDEDCDDYSPSSSCFITQNLVEKELVSVLDNYNKSTIWFSHEVMGFVQTSEYIICDVLDRHSGDVRKIQAEYVVGADGAHSFFRRALGIEMQGEEKLLGDHLSVYCKVDLSRWLGDKQFIVAAFTNPEQRSRFLMAVDHKTEWVFGTRSAESNEPLSKADSVALVRNMIGLPEISVDVIDSCIWHMAAANAIRYRDNRIFLCGDAAHRIPPTGGMGMNTGIGDAHNLAWKLAFVLRNEAPLSLLETYEVERKPLAQKTIDWSRDNAHRIRGMHEALEAGNTEQFKEALASQHKQLNHLGLDLGYIYHSNAVYTKPAKEAQFSPEIYQPKLIPGMRLPHCMVKVRGIVMPIQDLCEKEYVLIVTEAWLLRYQEVSPISASAPIAIYRIHRDIVGIDQQFEKLYQLDQYGLILIRPDGHVAYLA